MRRTLRPRSNGALLNSHEASLRALRDRHAGIVAHCDALLAALAPESIEQPKAAKASKTGKGRRRAPLAPGSLPARVIQILSEATGPLKSTEISVAAKADQADVVRELKALMEQRRLVRFGRFSGTKYGLMDAA